MEFLLQNNQCDVNSMTKSKSTPLHEVSFDFTNFFIIFMSIINLFMFWILIIRLCTKDTWKLSNYWSRKKPMLMLEHWANKPRYMMLLKMVSICHEFFYLVALRGPDILNRSKHKIRENDIFFLPGHLIGPFVLLYLKILCDKFSRKNCNL